MRHVAACCRRCVYCWRDVNFNAWRQHKTTCEGRLTATLTAFVLAGETHAGRLPGFYESDEPRWWYPMEFNEYTYTESTSWLH
jgi:wyosine [tRNA(Phe)-imidazoG37] synthetase (radical SAM superfamily)